MSWFSKNFEKAVLGGTLVVALGLVYVGWSKLVSVDDDFRIGLTGRGNTNTAVANAELVPKAMQSMKLDRTWTQGVDVDRPVDLFTGIALFIKSSAPDKPIDLPKDSPVHPPIPNSWWLEHRLDPGYTDSPNRDPDGDGFTNLEEFLAKTSPTSARQYPALINKLKFVKDESLTWVVLPGYGDGGKFPFSYEDSKHQTNRIPAGEAVAPDDLFFLKGPMAKRFKLLGSEIRREVNPNTHVEVEVTIVRIEDQHPNKKGKIYELPAPLQQGRKQQFQQFDRTAVLSLEALGAGGSEFKVEENTRFALPQNAPKKDYLLKKVTPEGITVEYPDPQGALKTVEIKKGSMPQPTE